MMASVPGSLPTMQLVSDPEQVAALRHRERRRALELLAEPGSATSLAPRLGSSRQRVNYHLRELERVGLARLVEERRRRNCVERVLQATARAYLLAPEMVGEDPEVAHDRFSSAWLMTQAARTVREVGELRDRASQQQRRLATLSLESELRFASAADRAAFADELAAALAGLVARYHDASAPGGRSFRLQLGLHPTIQKEDAHHD